MELEGLGTHGLELGDLLLRLEREFFLGGKLVTRRNPDDIAVLAHVQSASLQNEVQGLIPRHILQTKREVTRYAVAGDDVEVGEVGDDVQYTPYLDVLEIERKLLSMVAAPASLSQLVRIIGYRLHLQNELGIGLVCVVLPQALGLDHHARIVPLRESADDLHRRSEIDDVEALAQAVGNVRLQEVNDNLLPLTADIDPGGSIRKFDHDTAFAHAPAPETNVLQRVHDFGTAFRETRRRGGRGARSHGNEQRAAINLGFVPHQASQVEYDARAITDLHDVHRAQLTLADLLAAAPQTVRGVGKIECDARRGGTEPKHAKQTPRNKFTFIS